jgi:SAM-dependent methyltransferase
MSENPAELKRIYELRFSKVEEYRKSVWKVLTRNFFSRWIKKEHTVLDLGCGYGEFINNIEAANRYGMDLNPATATRLDKAVRFLEQDCSTHWQVPDASLDAVFTSNFLEHLPDKDAVKRTLAQAARCLKPGGLFIAMGPNIRYLPGAYWDFFDHHVILTERSLSEVLEVLGFSINKSIARFLPYTMVGGPQYPLFLLRIYLAMPWLWWIKGGQFLVIARR